MVHDARHGWQVLVDGAAALGDQLIGDDFPASSTDRAEGFLHLTEQLNCWLGWSVFHDDSRRPRFQRQNDLIAQWGGPNADNAYRHARISSDRRYRVTGIMHSCEEFMLAIRAGFMHEDRWGTLCEISATELGIAEGDEFSFTLGNAPGDDVNLPDGAVMATIREYYYDWRPLEPATFTITCLDDDVDAPRPRVTEEAVAENLRRGLIGAEHSVVNWNRYMAEHRAKAVDNTFDEIKSIDKGLAAARYRFCFWNLEPDDALVVTASVPEARYWSFQLYNMGWFELVDRNERQTSLNMRQMRIDADGLIRFVVSHRDPGVANWLDAGGRTVGLLTGRWFWFTSNPEMSTEVMPVDDVAAALAETSASITADERIATIRARRDHLAWRFRT